MKSTTKKVPLLHLELVREKTINYQKINQTRDIVQILHQMLDKSPVEQFVVIYINSNNSEIIGVEKIAIGTLDQVKFTLKEMFRGAICACVNRIAIGHNHPYGACKPSCDDIVLTSMAINIASLLGIRVMDHIIVSPNGDYYSIWNNRVKCFKSVHDIRAKQKLVKLQANNQLAKLTKLF
jgi:DNA repair protein RadC